MAGWKYTQTCTIIFILSRVGGGGSVTNNNGFWIGWFDLLTPSYHSYHKQFTRTHNTSSAQFWSEPFRSEPRLSSTNVPWLLSSAVPDLVQSYFTDELVLGSPFYCDSCWFTSCHVFYAWIRSESDVTTDGQSASLFWNKAPICGLRPDFYYCQTFGGLLTWGALSDERAGLLFTVAAGPRQRSHSRVRVPWYSWPYFTVSDSRLHLLSPPTTRWATVEVFDPAYTQDWIPHLHGSLHGVAADP
jgi:hypothetical protein